MSLRDFRRKQRDRFALAVLGSGLLGKLSPDDAVKAMFDVAEQIMDESERRYLNDKEVDTPERILRSSRGRGTRNPRTVQETSERQTD